MSALIDPSLTKQELLTPQFSIEYVDALKAREPDLLSSDYEVDVLSNEVVVARNILRETLASYVLEGLVDANEGNLSPVPTGYGQSYARYSRGMVRHVDSLIESYESLTGRNAALIGRRYVEGGYQAPHLDASRSQVSILLCTGGGITRVDTSPTTQSEYLFMTHGYTEPLDDTYWENREFIDVHVGDQDIAFVPGSTLIHGGVATDLTGERRDLVAINSL